MSSFTRRMYVCICMRICNVCRDNSKFYCHIVYVEKLKRRKKAIGALVYVWRLIRGIAKIFFPSLSHTCVTWSLRAECGQYGYAVLCDAHSHISRASRERDIEKKTTPVNITFFTRALCKAAMSCARPVCMYIYIHGLRVYTYWALSGTAMNIDATSILDYNSF